MGARLKRESLAVHRGRAVRSHDRGVERDEDGRDRRSGSSTSLRAQALAAGSRRLRVQVLKRGGGRAWDSWPSVGLEYLTLDRRGRHALRRRGAAHPAGQRRSDPASSACIYILDEPSIGLHQRDNKRRLVQTLAEACATWATPCSMVEHDEETIRSADLGHRLWTRRRGARRRGDRGGSGGRASSGKRAVTHRRNI